ALRAQALRAHAGDRRDSAPSTARACAEIPRKPRPRRGDYTDLEVPPRIVPIRELGLMAAKQRSFGTPAPACGLLDGLHASSNDFCIRDGAGRLRRWG